MFKLLKLLNFYNFFQKLIIIYFLFLINNVSYYIKTLDDFSLNIIINQRIISFCKYF